VVGVSRGRTATGPAATDTVIWHDVECCSYDADLSLWRELAAEWAGPVLDIGCGTGRVALDLAARGYEVTGLDPEPELVGAFAARARERGLHVGSAVADARSFELPGARFGLAIAAMQVFQLLGGETRRRGALACIREHLPAGGLLAAALADPFDGRPGEAELPPLPDVREQAGWVFSSTPIAVRGTDGFVEVDRLRQAVSPAGELREHLVTVTLERVEAATLEAAAEEVGYRVRPARRVPATADHVGSTVVLLEAIR
jgi:SAM-dependent methyltransferase